MEEDIDAFMLPASPILDMTLYYIVSDCETAFITRLFLNQENNEE